MKVRTMEPRMRDSSSCLFTSPVIGSRQGRILLVQHCDIKIPALDGVIRSIRYRSEKVADDVSGWRRFRIEREPRDPDYEPIRPDPRSEDDVLVLVEF
jgi:uncharacterized protein